MDKYGMIRVAACSPETRPGDVTANVQNILQLADECVSAGAEIVLFPELSVTGYSCADLFGQTLLIEQGYEGVREIGRHFAGTPAVIVVGVPVRSGNSLYNCAAVVQNGKVCGLVPKTHIPNYNEFYEARWFRGATPLRQITTGNPFGCPFGTNVIFELGGVRVGIEICEDLWVPIPPSSALASQGADIILNLSATNELIGKHAYLLDLIRNQSGRCMCGYVYASAGLGESSTDLAFAGNCIVAENGTLLAQSPRFTLSAKKAIADIDVDYLRHDRQLHNTFHDLPVAAEEPGDSKSEGITLVKLGDPTEKTEEHALRYRNVDPHPFVDEEKASMAARCREISSIQSWGLAVRLRAINCRKAVIGISGGLDSTLALLVTVKAFDMLGLDRKGIIGVTMPGMGTTERTHSNASRLMQLLGVTEREIPIGEAVRQHFADIGHDPAIHDVTYENSQARERTQILMDLANQENAIVVGTGDLSELALGWCTYNGDQMSMYGVNASIPKTLVKYLVEGYAREAGGELEKVLDDIIDTPISPELLPPTEEDDIEQKTEDLVGPYELHDFFMYHILRHGAEPKKILRMAEKAFGNRYEADTIKKWLKTFYRRFFSQQFKRSCMPDGVKAGSVCLSPRGDWRMPSDASARLWMSQLD